MVKRLAIIARMDDSGLGHQTRDLVRLLNPDKVIAIDFSFYNHFKQYPEWYKKYDTTYITGFIQDHQVHELAKEADVVITAETFYNNNFINIANQAGLATINQINYEFFEPLANRSLLLPSKILMPSYWHLDDLRRMTAPGRVEYLPPPTFTDDYESIRKENYERTGKRRFLHIAGKMAAHDRAGTLSLIDAMKHVEGDFELVVKVQSGEMLRTDDHRITLDYSFPKDEKELYRGFDAMIHPRRYAGLNLPMNEALASGLPVIMPNIEPNNRVLPMYWLVNAQLATSFFARTQIDVYATVPVQLGNKIKELATIDDELLKRYKQQAYQIAKREFDNPANEEKWASIIENVSV